MNCLKKLVKLDLSNELEIDDFINSNQCLNNKKQIEMKFENSPSFVIDRLEWVEEEAKKVIGEEVFHFATLLVSGDLYLMVGKRSDKIYLYQHNLFIVISKSRQCFVEHGFDKDWNKFLNKS